ncbi:MAG: histidine kinase dimerization/phospho-acceptor domain-containing protein [Candidatus Acidiferrales bacterium]
MNSARHTIFIICADPIVAQSCIEELAAFGGRYRTPTASSVDMARKFFSKTQPSVVFLDQSSIDTGEDGETLESAVAVLAETAPVVVAAAPEKQGDLGFLITSGAVDFVSRTRHFLPIVAGMLDRRMRIVERIAGMIRFPNDDLAGDFGEILRHEVNNPLTGILGNTELLLARREGLPPGAIERLQTIAELAVRLRETVRRLSNAWDEKHEHARPA